MKNAHVWILLSLTLLPLQVARADTADGVLAFAHCRSIPAEAERLRCYDRAASALSPQAESPAPPPEPVITAQPAAAPPAPTPRPETAAAAPAKPATDTASFGAETLPSATAKEKSAPDEIHSRIRGEFRGWEAKTRFELENGQVWECLNCRSVYLVRQDPDVTIKRGFMGGYWLKVEGLNTQAPVRRIK